MGFHKHADSLVALLFGEKHWARNNETFLIRKCQAIFHDDGAFLMATVPFPTGDGAATALARPTGRSSYIIHL